MTFWQFHILYMMFHNYICLILSRLEPSDKILMHPDTKKLLLKEKSISKKLLHNGLDKISHIAKGGLSQIPNEKR